MILIGTMNLTRTRQTGQFYCPSCACHQEYRLRSRRPFLTLYFIPVVPIGAAELFVHCTACREKWDPTVLEMDQRTHEAIQNDQFRDEALRSAILVVLEDGSICESEITVLQRIAFRLFDRQLNRDELGELCSIAQQNKIVARNYVLTVSRRWNEKQKAEALGAMFLAATAEGKMEAPQMKVMTEMQAILNLTEQEYQQAIEDALRWEHV
ncbi:MAG: zinc-ribbon domain-containing protein [Planctomycetales bacterium]|nr:zinc-ribbon domain-containing protein [Planctomycetales bacterium]